MYLARLLHHRRAINLLHLTSAKKTAWVPCKDFKDVWSQKLCSKFPQHLPLKIYYNVKVPKIMLNHREMGYWSSVSPFAFTLLSLSLTPYRNLSFCQMLIDIHWRWRREANVENKLQNWSHKGSSFIESSRKRGNHTKTNWEAIRIST